MEGMLSDVGDTQIGVLPHQPVDGLKLSCEQLDHSRLAGTVGAMDGNARVQRAVDAHLVQHVLVCARVPEKSHKPSQQSLKLAEVKMCYPTCFFRSSNSSQQQAVPWSGVSQYALHQAIQAQQQIAKDSHKIPSLPFSA